LSGHKSPRVLGSSLSSWSEMVDEKAKQLIRRLTD